MADTVYLVWDPATFTTGMTEVRAPYASLEDAKAQAEHDHELGRKPLRIEDAHGKVLWTPK